MCVMSSSLVCQLATGWLTIYLTGPAWFTILQGWLTILYVVSPFFDQLILQMLAGSLFCLS